MVELFPDCNSFGARKKIDISNFLKSLQNSENQQDNLKLSNHSRLIN